MPRVVAVVTSYWLERLDNVYRIVKDLKAGTVKPDRILVLNNNRDTSLDGRAFGAEVVNSQFNSRTRGKFAVALMDAADYYIILDDDTSVGPRTLEKFMSVADRDSLYASHGKMLGGWKNHHDAIFPRQINKPTPCDYVLATGMFISFNCIVRMFQAEEFIRLPTEWKHQAEDILVGLVNKPVIIPLSGKSDFINLPWNGVAMVHGSDGITNNADEYYQMRYDFIDEALEILKEHPLPDYE